MQKGKFITVEGTEGAGKTTSLQFIKKYFQDIQHDIVWTREPGGTPLAEKIRDILLKPLTDEVMAAETELLLMFAARAQHLQQCILPALVAGKWVVSDRFVDASYAYQGGGRKMDLQKIKMLDQLVVNHHYPDLTLLLDISPEMGFARAEKRGTEKDRIEQEKIDFFVRVREGYLARAQQDPQRIKVIDASADVLEVENQIRRALDTFMSNP